MDQFKTASLQTYLSTAPEIIDEARAGRMFILVDDEDRENEGDLVIPAQFATPDAVNFMARHARGLICLALTRSRCDTLGLKLMTRSNQSRHETAFTVSIEAREGVTTGISAADRARTVAVAINPECGAADIVSPGHIFPLVARDGGTLVRTGHTEAAVDIARLAGLTPAGVICEIMNEDGTMARLPDLVAFAQYHNLKLGTIADLIAHRRRTEKLIRRTAEGMIADGAGQTWRAVSFESAIDHVEHLALVKGDVAAEEPVLVRMHAISTIDDIMGGGHMSDLRHAMAQIADAGRGVVVLIRETRPDAVSARLHQIVGGARAETVLRDYGIGAQILAELGVRDMILLSNHKRAVIGLEGYGLNIVDQLPIEESTTP
ncbi:MAG TPA: 3,4-dihydroxy-2-butanone-4-phosphate synthase [Acidiphilium sp.]